MQFDMFAPPIEKPVLELLEHLSSSYGPRTGVNAREADVTVAFAIDYSTAGERLTAKVADKRYVAVPFDSEIDVAVEPLVEFLAKKNGRTLNVAGNGIYTFDKHGITQEEVNYWVFNVLKRTNSRVPLTHIRSGGQTGADTAGLVAGLALGIPVTGLYPRGFKRRLVSGVDVDSSPTQLEQELRAQAARLQ